MNNNRDNVLNNNNPQLNHEENIRMQVGLDRFRDEINRQQPAVNDGFPAQLLDKPYLSGYSPKYDELWAKVRNVKLSTLDTKISNIEETEIEQPKKGEIINFTRAIIYDLHQKRLKSSYSSPVSTQENSGLIEIIRSVTVGDLFDSGKEALAKINEVVPVEVSAPVLNTGFNLISGLFIYKSILKQFEELVFQKHKVIPGSVIWEHSLEVRNRELKNLSRVSMYLAAALMGIKYLTTHPLISFKAMSPKTEELFSSLGLESSTPLSENTDVQKKGVKGLFLFLTKIKNKIPLWLRFLFIAGYSIFFLIAPPLFGENTDSTPFSTSFLTDNLGLKWVLIIATFVFLYFSIKYFLNLVLFILFSKNKEIIGEYLPETTINWLNYLKDLSANAKINNDRGKIIEYFLKFAFIYLSLSILFFGLLYLLFF